MPPKPPRWNVSPALIAPEARGLWNGVAFVFPGFAGAHLGGGGLLLGPAGAPLPGITMTAAATAEASVTPYGPGVGISGSSNLLQRDNFEPVVTSDGAGTGDFTLLVLANPIAESRLSMPVAQCASTANPGVLLHFNSNGANASAGGFALRTRDGTGFTATAAAGTINGQYHVFVGRRAEANIDVFVDGVLRATSSGAIRAITNGAMGLAIGQRAESANDRIDTACNIVLAGAWNRALSSAEIRLLARDPFIMLRPFPEWRGLWTPLGGNTILSPGDLTPAFAFETPALPQAHNLSAADAQLAESFETPAFSQIHHLSPEELALAEGLESAGFAQAHAVALQEMNCGINFDAAALVMSSAGAPGFRTGKAGAPRTVKINAADNRNVQPQNGGRRKSITE